MKYIVVHIPSGLYLIHNGINKIIEEKYCLFSKLGLLNPITEDIIDKFKYKMNKLYLSGNDKALKYASYTNKQIEEMFIRTPRKFESCEKAKETILKSYNFPGLGKEFRHRKLTESELVLFDIMEVEDD